jgi:4-hydroxy-3-methylbut-2-enyl diphosphate reductase
LNVQRKAESLASEGYEVVILGDARHPEVRGILGHVGGEALVIGSASDVPRGRKFLKVGILSQTTQEESALAESAANFVFFTEEVKVYNTICRATIERQESVKRLAGQVDAIVVIGGRDSANTRGLVEISRSLGSPTLWVESAGELDRGWLRGKRIIGVAAGGSTPDWLVNELTRKLQRL